MDPGTRVAWEVAGLMALGALALVALVGLAWGVATVLARLTTRGPGEDDRAH